MNETKKIILLGAIALYSLTGAVFMEMKAEVSRQELYCQQEREVLLLLQMAVELKAECREIEAILNPGWAKGMTEGH